MSSTSPRRPDGHHVSSSVVLRALQEQSPRGFAWDDYRSAQNSSSSPRSPRQRNGRDSVSSPRRSSMDVSSSSPRLEVVEFVQDQLKKSLEERYNIPTHRPPVPTSDSSPLCEEDRREDEEDEEAVSRLDRVHSRKKILGCSVAPESRSHNAVAAKRMSETSLPMLLLSHPPGSTHFRRISPTSFPSVPSRVAISPVRRSHSPLSPRIPDPCENRSEQIHHVLSEIADSFTISERSPDARTRCRESTRSPSRHASSERTAKTNSHSDLKDDIGTKRGNLSPYLQSSPSKFSSQRPPVLETIPSAPPSIRSQEYRDESVERFRQSYSPRSFVQSSSSPKRFGVDTGCEDLSINHQQYELSFPLDYSTTSPPLNSLYSDSEMHEVHEEAKRRAMENAHLAAQAAAYYATAGFHRPASSVDDATLESTEDSSPSILPSTLNTFPDFDSPTRTLSRLSDPRYKLWLDTLASDFDFDANSGIWKRSDESPVCALPSPRSPVVYGSNSRFRPLDPTSSPSHVTASSPCASPRTHVSTLSPRSLNRSPVSSLAARRSSNVEIFEQGWDSRYTPSKTFSSPSANQSDCRSSSLYERAEQYISSKLRRGVYRRQRVARSHTHSLIRDPSLPILKNR